MCKVVTIQTEVIANGRELDLLIRMLEFAKQAGYTSVWDHQCGTQNFVDYTIDDAIEKLKSGLILAQGQNPTDFDEAELLKDDLPH